MKQLIYTFILIISCISAQAQESICPHSNTTGLAPTSDGWDWRSQTYEFYLEGETGVHIMRSPFYGRNLASNQNVDHFDLGNTTWRDFEPNEGWRLVQRSFGTPTERTNYPHFVLYNKYTGLLRIFIAIGRREGDAEAQKAILRLRHENNSFKTAVLDIHVPDSLNGRAEGNLNALAQFVDFYPDDDIAGVEIANFYKQDTPYWIYGDFVMNYDPCTCTQASRLYFDVELIRESKLTFELEGSILQDIDETGVSSNSRQKISAQDLVSNIKGAVDAGISGYKSAASGLKDALELLNIPSQSTTTAIEPFFDGGLQVYMYF